MTRSIAAFALPILLLAGTQSAGGQLPAREFTLDLRPFAGQAAFAWRVGPQAYLGVGLGGGFDQIGKTFKPDTDSGAFHDLEQILHLDVVLRAKPSTRIDIDLGLRGGLGDVRSCTASDCWPGTYVGVFAALFVGGRRWKVGPRLLIARSTDGPNNDAVVHAEVLALRFTNVR